jgi:hypothetical protein
MKGHFVGASVACVWRTQKTLPENHLVRGKKSGLSSVWYDS